MKRCPVSHLPVREEPEWIASHPENDYVTVFRLIGTDIIHFCHRSPKSEIVLAGIDSQRFLNILQDLELIHIPVYLLVDLEKVTHISYHYSKNFLNFAFNWGRNIRMVVLYNICNEIRNGLERFCLIAPESVCMTTTGNYREAVDMIMDMKSRKSRSEVAKNLPAGPEALKKELLASMARMSLLQIFNQQLHPPAPEDELYPYFLAVEAFRKDMITKETLYRERKKALQKTCQQKWNDACQRLEQEALQHSSKAKAHQNLIISFEADLGLHEEEMLRLKAIEEKINRSAEKLLRRLEILGRNDLTEHFHNNFADNEPPGLTLTPADTLFLDKLKHRHPELTGSELKICLLIRKNHSTKTIARMQATSTRGMESIRYRLHKKLGLGKHLSMKTYLGSI